VSARVTAAPAGDALPFLADLATALHLSNLPSDAIEARVGAAARGLGLEVNALVLQSALLLARHDGGRAHLRRIEVGTHWNLTRLHDLVTLAEETADGRVALAEARAELERILAAPKFPKPVVVLGYAVYGAAVAARIGGGIVEILVAGVVGVLAS
jgi:uncharacterized membrane protein YjjP (DUF1212 family)